jgi:hypothetical protein
VQRIVINKSEDKSWLGRLVRPGRPVYDFMLYRNYLITAKMYFTRWVLSR